MGILGKALAVGAASKAVRGRGRTTASPAGRGYGRTRTPAARGTTGGGLLRRFLRG